MATPTKPQLFVVPKRYFYYTGDTIQGFIAILTPEKTQIDELKIRFYNKIKVEWLEVAANLVTVQQPGEPLQNISTTQGDKITTQFSATAISNPSSATSSPNSIITFSEKKLEFEAFKDLEVFSNHPATSVAYEFSFRVPEQLAASFRRAMIEPKSNFVSKPWAAFISYKLKAYLKLTNIAKPVVSKVEILIAEAKKNDFPRERQQVALVPGTCCFQGGQITLKCTLNQTDYYEHDVGVVSVTCDNASSVDVHTISFQLIRTINLRNGKGSSTTITHLLEALSAGFLAPKFSVKSENFNFPYDCIMQSNNFFHVLTPLVSCNYVLRVSMASVVVDCPLRISPKQGREPVLTLPGWASIITNKVAYVEPEKRNRNVVKSAITPGGEAISQAVNTTTKVASQAVNTTTKVASQAASKAVNITSDTASKAVNQIGNLGASVLRVGKRKN
eukprot:TRINITY_DN110_c0_g1_i2.p1 TRINITY_DN110_c0_g1~~TRINITY_DN110_c0_g1_i2.p1  ORF type:complete len:446 (-),score=187.03 TRINITY_DN110_c0_g1_i2:65-1402(-)